MRLAMIFFFFGCAPRGAEMPPPPPVDIASSAAEAERLCALGSVEGCTSLGVAHAEGLGAPYDEDKAVDLFSRSCAAGHALACVELAAMEPSRIVPETLAEKAFPILDEDCARSLPSDDRDVRQTYRASSCEVAGRMLEAGRGVAKNEAAAEERYRRGCSRNRATCFITFYRDGPGRLPIGARCDGDSIMPCGEGTYCTAGPGRIPVCLPKRPVGAPCTDREQCNIGYCERRCLNPPMHLD
jgi:TPR repeat protein